MNIKLRKATEADSNDLLRWRNDPRAYQYYHNPEPVDEATHSDWLSASLSSTTREIYIVEENDTRVGMIRFDQIDAHNTELSWVVDPDHQRRGIGTALLKVARRMKDGALLAEIKKENIGSIKIAEAVGFELVRIEDGTLFFQSMSSK